MMISVDQKVDIICATLATGIYRPWYWQNYKAPAKQSAFRSDWRAVLIRVHPAEITKGLKNWSSTYGKDSPPTPAEFIDFIKPKHTTASREGLRLARQSIGIPE